MVKQVTISESNWHYKLVKWVFKIDPKMFNNFCPYFWLVIAGIFLLFPVLIFRTISVPIKKLINTWKQKSYDKFLISLSGTQVYALHVGAWYVKHFEPIFSSSYNKEKVVKDYLKINKIELHDLYRNYYEEYQRIIFDDEKKKNLYKKRMVKISSATKEISRYFLMILAVFIGLVVTNVIISIGFLFSGISKGDLGILFLFFLTQLSIIAFPCLSKSLWKKKENNFGGHNIFMLYQSGL